MATRLAAVVRAAQGAAGQAGQVDQWHMHHRSTSKSWNGLDEKTKRAIEQQEKEQRKQEKADGVAMMVEYDEMLAWLDKR